MHESICLHATLDMLQ